LTIGTGLSGTSYNGSAAVTIANTGVTSVAAGSGISVSASTGGVTISASGGGTVSSVATGNGLSGGTITSTGTLIIACPGFNTVGSYAAADFVYPQTAGSNYAGPVYYNINSAQDAVSGGNLSGTWKAMGYMSAGRSLWCRVS
jgi:hypothetical protein